MRLFIAPTSSVVGAMPAWICRVVRRSSERKLISRAASASPAALPSTVTGSPAARTLASVFSWMTLVSPLVFLYTVSADTCTMCAVRAWSTTVMVSPCTAVITPLSLVLAGSAASAAREVRPTSTSSRRAAARDTVRVDMGQLQERGR